MYILLGSIVTILLPVLLGGYLAYPFHSFRGLIGFFSVGAVVGPALFASLAFFVALQFHVSWMTIGLSLVLMLFLAWVVRVNGVVSSRYRDEPAGLKESSAALFFLVISLVLVVATMREVLLVKPSGLDMGFEKNLGDLPLHLHIATSFLYADNLPPMNPIYSGVPLRYPFLVDFYSALIWFATKNVEVAFEWPGILWGIAFVFLFSQWTTHLTRSLLAGSVAPLLFLLSGGWGFVYWMKDMVARAPGMDVLPRSYTLFGEHQLEWGNVLYSLFITQRGLQLAFPLMILACAVLFDAAKDKNYKFFGFLALALAPLPYIHGHSTIVFCTIAFAIFLFYPAWQWIYLLFPLGMFWAPQILYLASVLGAKVPGAISFTRIDLGWMVDGLQIPWFWIKNTGVFIPLCMIGMMSSRREVKALVLGGFAVFLLGNTILFAPWNWDNIKILIFWYLVCIPPVAFLLAKLMLEHGFLARIGAAGLLVTLIFSGSLDLARALRPNGETMGFFSREELAFAERIRNETPKAAVFAVAPTYNQPLVLTGRSMVMGYAGHVWSHGLPGNEREADVKAILRGQAGSRDLLEKYDVTHALWGWREREQNFAPEDMLVNFTPRFAGAGYQLFERR